MLVNNDLLKLIFSFATGFFVVYFAIPSIVRVAKLKNFYDEPNYRKVHTNNIPTLGGLAIFAGTILGFCIWGDFNDADYLQQLIASMVILLFAGIKDDILVIAPITKLAGQIFCCYIIVVLGDIRITHFYGFFGIDLLPFWVSVSFTIFFILSIINGFNFIDGIDGLASTIGILVSSSLVFWFVITGKYTQAILGLALIGSLVGFFIYNVFGKENKIFMGDTGSQLLGLITSVISIDFLEINYLSPPQFHFLSAPALVMAILFIPIFDIIRVTFIRIVLGNPIQKADRNHIHHRLIQLGFSHLKSTLILGLTNILFIVFVLIFNKLGTFQLMAMMLIAGTLLSYLISVLLKRKNTVCSPL